MKWHLLKGNLKRWLNNKHNWVIRYSNCITCVDSTHFLNILMFVSAYHTGWFLTPDITLGINKSAFKHTRIKRLIFDINIFRPLFGNYWNLLNFMFLGFPWVCQCTTWNLLMSGNTNIFSISIDTTRQDWFSSTKYRGAIRSNKYWCNWLSCKN